MQTSKKSSTATIGKTYASYNLNKIFQFFGNMRQNKKGNIFPRWYRENNFNFFYLLSSDALSALFSVKLTLDSLASIFDLAMGQVLTPAQKRFINSLCVCMGHCCNLGWLCSSISRWCFFVCCCTTSYADIFEKRSENCRPLKVCNWFKALFEYDTCFQPCWFKFEYNIKQGRRH